MSAGRYHWSHAAQTPRFFFIHAAAAAPLLALLLHPAWITLWIALGTVVALVWVERVRKLTPLAFWRSLNIVFTGRVKPTVNILKELTR